MSRPRTIERDIHPLVEQLRQRRLALGLSQTELANLVGLETYGTISEVERGVVSPTLATLGPWAEALGCRLELMEIE